MAVERIDVGLPNLISGPSLETQQKIADEDSADAARKAAEKKVVEKQLVIKQSVVQRETFSRDAAVDQRMQQILGGSHGPDAANALGGWQQNQQLQSKLTDAQRNLFREAMAQNPGKGAEAGSALNRLSQQPGFQKAVTSSQQMGTLQDGIVKNPKLEKPVSEMLGGRFMQSPKADPTTKNQFLRFGMDQAGKGNLDSVRRAGDMLGSLAGTGMPRGAQRATMTMVLRNPGDTSAMGNVDQFAQHQDVRSMPSFARGKATELLAKSGGKGEVKDGLTQLASDPKFKAQTAENKGRFFATIGTGRPSEYRALTDKTLGALQSSDFPSRSGQVGRFLQKMAGQVTRGGSESVDTGTLVKDAKKSVMPTPPKFLSTEGLSDEEAAAARAQNRGAMLHFFNQLEKLYANGEKKLTSAKYLEDVNALQTLREPSPADISVLSPEDQALYNDRALSLRTRRDKVMKLHKEKSRELRNKRMPPAKRRALEAQKRVAGRQPKYFSPNTGVGGSQAFTAPSGTGALRPGGLPSTPARGTIAARGNLAVAGGDIGSQVAAAVANLGTGPITADKAGQVAQVIAQQVAAQVAQQVTAQLLGGAPAVGIADPRIAEIPEGDKELIKKHEKTQSGKVDGWGIQRTFSRDLGAARSTPVKPPTVSEAAGPTFDQVVSEKYTGRTLVKDPSAIRQGEELFGAAWKELTKPEQALLKNLGWNQQTWDTKDTPAAKWPMAMATAFINLNPTQREAVRKLGFTANDWDKRVQAFSMGKNA